MSSPQTLQPHKTQLSPGLYHHRKCKNPGRHIRTGFTQGMLRPLAEFFVDLETFPVRILHPPACLRVLFQSLQTFLLCLFREVKPELDDQSAFIDEHLFKTVDFVNALGKFRCLALAYHPIDDGICVPGTEKDADFPLGW